MTAQMGMTKMALSVLQVSAHLASWSFPLAIATTCIKVCLGPCDVLYSVTNLRVIK